MKTKSHIRRASIKAVTNSYRSIWVKASITPHLRQTHTDMLKREKVVKLIKTV